MKLISSKGYGKTLASKTDEDYRLLRNWYDVFLDQPLELGMFIPCKDGKPLEKPESLKGYYESSKEGMTQEKQAREEYQEAKDKVLFESKFTLDTTIFGNYKVIVINMKRILFDTNGMSYSEGYIEHLVRHGLTLTPNAIKQIGL